LEAPEAIALLIGVLLRLRMPSTFSFMWGYDYSSHVAYVGYVVEHHALPSIDLFRAAYHPPLYYWIAAFVVQHGSTVEHLPTLSAGFGAVRLIIVWAGLRRVLPDHRLARVVALLLAGVMPCALHVDGMVSNEALNNLLSTAALAAMFMTFASAGRKRMLWAISLGLLLAGAMLTKVSALVFVMVVAGGAIGEAIATDGTALQRVRRAVPLVAALGIALGLSLPIHARHLSQTGKLFPTAFDGMPLERKMVEDASQVPYLRRRSLGYYVGLGGIDTFRAPYWPTGSEPPRFWPVLFASTFADYYNFSFAGFPGNNEPFTVVNKRRMQPTAFQFMKASAIAGLPIAIATILAFLGAAIVLARRRDVSRLVLLVVPVLAVLGQLHFTIKYPFDNQGIVKGAYFQFAAAPLYALFGLAVSWLWKRPRWRAIAGLQIACLSTLMAYSIYSRRPSVFPVNEFRSFPVTSASLKPGVVVPPNRSRTYGEPHPAVGPPPRDTVREPR
jgi:hypothetical protein